jgi:hypothetical protein
MGSIGVVELSILGFVVLVGIAVVAVGVVIYARNNRQSGE